MRLGLCMCEFCVREQDVLYYKIDGCNCSHDTSHQKISEFRIWEMLDN